MTGQLNLFDYGISFCSDPDINKIVEALDARCKKFGVICDDKPDFRVWAHVPNLGPRLTYNMMIPKELFDAMMDELDPIIVWAKERGIELSALNGWSPTTDDYNVYVFSRYTTSKWKRRKWND